jgi:hypothetical protein
MNPKINNNNKKIPPVTIFFPKLRKGCSHDVRNRGMGAHMFYYPSNNKFRYIHKVYILFWISILISIILLLFIIQ